MILKLKAFIYRLTGFYFARNDEIRYLESDEFLNEFKRMNNHPSNTFDAHAIRGILIGSWQAKHGFYKKYWLKYVLIFSLMTTNVLNNVAVKECLEKNFHKCDTFIDQFQCKIDNMVECIKLEKK